MLPRYLFDWYENLLPSILYEKFLNDQYYGSFVASLISFTMLKFMALSTVMLFLVLPPQLIWEIKQSCLFSFLNYTFLVTIKKLVTSPRMSCICWDVHWISPFANMPIAFGSYKVCWMQSCITVSCLIFSSLKIFRERS